MNIAVGQSINSHIYVEHDYQGDLPTKNLPEVAAIDWAGWLQKWLTSLSKTTELPQDCELSLKLTSDGGIQQYNLQYRNLDSSTDVLAFAAMESQMELPEDLNEPFYLGDIIISLDTAMRQAQEQKHSLKLELAWLSSHGLLHLLGWDHPDDESLRQMLDRQGKLIQLLNISDAD